jgi:hypothetical protein
MQTGVGWLLDLSWSGTVHNGAPVYSSLDYQHAMVVVPISLLVSAFLAFLVKDKQLRLQ